MNVDQRLISKRSPRSSQYHPEWITSNVSGGANSLWLTEWLTTALDLQKMALLNAAKLISN